MARKILIINPFGIGDVLFSTPLVSAIKKETLGCYIGYICNIRTREILETNPDISEIFVFERDEYRALWKQSKTAYVKKIFDFWKEIKKRRFDTLIDLSLGKEYAFLCWLIGIKERRGFDYKGRGRFLTHKVPFDGFNDKPVARYYMDLIGFRDENGGKITTVLLPTDDDRAYIDNFLKSRGIKEKENLVGIAPGGGISFGRKDKERRRWSSKKFGELANKIVERFNIKIVLVWGPGEKGLVEEIAGFMKERPLIAPETSIRQMAALCGRCRAVICSEGGPLHIASSQGVKTLSVFGPVDERVYGPYPRGEDNIVITSSVDCRPCYRRFKLPECDTRKCLEEISVDSVFNALRRKL